MSVYIFCIDDSLKINPIGDVVYVETMGQSIVVLGSDQAASDLLEKRSAIYSDRPRILTFEL